MTKTTAREQRFARRREVLNTVDGEAGAKFIDALGNVSPELADQVVVWAFGEMCARPALQPRDRQLVTLELTPTEITGATLHAAVYCGFPRTRNATFATKKVFAERGLLPVA